MRVASDRLRSAVSAAALFGIALFVLACARDEARSEIRIPLGAGGVGFLPLMMMREFELVEKHAELAGRTDIRVRWIALGGPAIMNDALLSGSVDFIAAGPPAFLTLWDRTRDAVQVGGVAAMASLPMYLNTRSERLRALDDLGDQDKIAVTAVKVSIPAIIMQMVAANRYGIEQAYRFDRYTVTMTHADALVAMLSGAGEVTAHFTSPPFHQREIREPGIRTLMSSDDVMGGATTFTMLSTTARFRSENPVAYAAVLGALEEANAMIRADPTTAARVLIEADGGGGFTPGEIVAVLEDPDIEFTTTPENVMKYATFMHEIGSLDHLPASWRDLFFADIHATPGS
jgi:NitT/TauT family transport system substrate-binding protein